MYHEEQIINGVLCHRSTPTGEWIPYTVEQLTTKYEQLNVRLIQTEQKLEKWQSAATHVGPRGIYG